jgi:hypothetical protein
LWVHQEKTFDDLEQFLQHVIQIGSCAAVIIKMIIIKPEIGIFDDLESSEAAQRPVAFF